MSEIEMCFLRYCPVCGHEMRYQGSDSDFLYFITLCGHDDMIIDRDTGRRHPAASDSY
jgi:hypothetical protein